VSEAPTLPELMTLEPAGESAFVGQFRVLGRRSAYGGLVIGQALAAAMRTVPDLMPHSLHAYFLRPGDPAHPVTYTVDAFQDGRSFKTRRVEATQNGQTILTMLLSFQAAEEGLDYHHPMPEVPAPEGLPTGEEMARRYFDSLAPDDPRRQVSAQRSVFELRHVHPAGFFESAAPRSENRFWFRSVNAVPPDPLLRYCALAYASDFGPMATALLPHRKSPVSDGIRLASLDHAIWFHREPRFDDWLLCDLDTPSSQGGRGLSFGRIFSRDGRLIASIAQEGVMRVRPG
jgi:acyl-CoA thioesterase-2